METGHPLESEFAPQSRAPDISVIVPAFREAQNLPVLVPRVCEALRGAGLEGEILVVDDDSQDGTPEVCRDLAERYPVTLLVRKNERGLSSAVIHGMRHARGSVLLVMDADLSHPPEKVPDLYRALDDEDVDFVIGSRYVSGGGTEGGWGFLRKLNSLGATLLALPLTKARDSMAGFFALRRATFESAKDLDPIGYKIGLELMVKCGCHNVHEVPILFAKRLHGSSKLSLREQIHYLIHLKRLYEFRLGRAARPTKFFLVGGTGFVIDNLAFFSFLELLHLPLEVSRAMAIWTAMTWNFWWNRRWTFSDAPNRAILVQYVLFCLSCVVGAFVNWRVSISLMRLSTFFERWKPCAIFFGVVVGMAFNYVLSLTVVFRIRKRRQDGVHS